MDLRPLKPGSACIGQRAKLAVSSSNTRPTIQPQFPICPLIEKGDEEQRQQDAEGAVVVGHVLGDHGVLFRGAECWHAG